MLPNFAHLFISTKQGFMLTNITHLFTSAKYKFSALRSIYYFDVNFWIFSSIKGRINNGTCINITDMNCQDFIVY